MADYRSILARPEPVFVKFEADQPAARAVFDRVRQNSDVVLMDLRK
jgi:hypothetical protein